MSSTAPSLWPPPPRILEQNQGFGVYIHFPWCLAKCPYCDFLSLPASAHVAPNSSAQETRAALPHAQYAEAILRELELRQVGLVTGKLRSIFVGGGTPSLWHPESLGKVIGGVLRHFDANAASVEITAEANPSSLDPEHFEALAKIGVNRVSIGVQSLDASRLGFLGRLHNAGEAKTRVSQGLASAIPRVSADMIYGVFGQAPDDAVREIGEVAGLGVSHISAYTLTIEPNTRFGELERRGKLPLLNEARVAESYALVSSHLENLGFEHYEISNFARPGQASLHNLGYWHGDDYLGLGVGAVGTVTTTLPGEGRLRYKNIASVDRYMSLLGEKSPELSKLSLENERIDGRTAIAESLMLGLRTRDGVDLNFEQERRGVEAWTRERQKAIDRLVGRGLLTLEDSRLRIPKQHWIVADGVIRDLI